MTCRLVPIGGLLGGLLIAACAGATPAQSPAPAPTPAPPAAAPADPNASFAGKRVSAADPLTLTFEPVLIEGCGVVLALEKVDWVSSENARGETVREGTAVIRASVGEDQRRLRIAEGDARTAFGCRIAVTKASEIYDEQAMDYLPIAELRLSPSP